MWNINRQTSTHTRNKQQHGTSQQLHVAPCGWSTEDASGWSTEDASGWSTEDASGWSTEDASGWSTEDASGWSTEDASGWSTEDASGWSTEDASGWRTEDASGWSTEDASGWSTEDASGWRTEDASGWRTEDASGWSAEDASGWSAEDASDWSTEDASDWSTEDASGWLEHKRMLQAGAQRMLQTGAQRMLQAGWSTEDASGWSTRMIQAGNKGCSGWSTEDAQNWSTEDCFRLEPGVPLDLVDLMLEERGVQVDQEGLQRLTAESQVKSGGQTGVQSQVLDVLSLAELQRLRVPHTDDSLKYQYSLQRDRYVFPACSAVVLALYDGSSLVSEVGEGQRCFVVLDQTCFYSEQGGQSHDHGYFTRDGLQDVPFPVEAVEQAGGYVVHQVTTAGPLKTGDQVQLHLDQVHRMSLMVNHTATHLLNFSLKTVLGDSVQQRGSHVSAERLRFDFSCK
ncbi:hypothetical protein KUCAC02_037575, partial [Chaenocephalus aceratus]